MNARPIRRAVIAAGALLVSACAMTPTGTPDRDALAKEFLTEPASSAIYVYRNPFNYYDTDPVLFVNGRIIGTTPPGTYYRIDTVPGNNVLHGTGLDLGQLTMDVQAGRLYFVSLSVLGGQSQYQVVPEDLGRERLRTCCTLHENWNPVAARLKVR